MKNVLLTTTALVAFAGSAFAASHAGGPNVTFGGDAEVKYNTGVNGSGGFGLDFSANLDITASIALNNGITAGVTYTLSLHDFGGDHGDVYPVIFLESAYGKLSAGNGDAIGPASDHFSETSSVSGFDDGEYGSDYDFAVRLDSSFSGIDFSISESDVQFGSGDTRVGVSGSFGSVDFGLGYGDDVWGESQVGLNVGTAFGAFEVDFSVFNGQFSGTDYGIEVAYAINTAITVGAYFASLNDATSQEYGVSVDYTSGPLTVGVSYDDGNVITGNAAIDVEYALAGSSAGVVFFAGYDQAGGAYVGVEYDLGSDAKAWFSYSEFDESGDPEFDEGITVGLSISF